MKNLIDMVISLLVALAFGVIPLLLLALYSKAVNASEISCAKHPSYCQIIKNRPKISKRHAMRVANAIHHAARKYKVPKRLYTAILAQESMYSVKAKNCRKGLDAENRPVEVCFDYGISQVNWRTAKRYGLNLATLTSNLKYSVEAGARILRDFKRRYEKKEDNWWSRYNSSTKSHRLEYERKVKRWF
jgi:soluble lytic murein transglycosylase-like protein